jgi:AcrR family transcriptional regulator
MSSAKPTESEMKRRMEVRALVARVYSHSSVSMEKLAAAAGVTRGAIWYLLHAESYDTRPITLELILAWLANPDTQEFARRLLSELISMHDVQQLRLIDLMRYENNTTQSALAVTVVKNLAERYGLIPANQTNTADVIAK